MKVTKIVQTQYVSDTMQSIPATQISDFVDALKKAGVDVQYYDLNIEEDKHGYKQIFLTQTVRRYYDKSTLHMMEK